MKRKLYRSIMLIMVFIIVSCQKTIIIPVDDVEKKIVIEGLIIKSDKTPNNAVYFYVSKLSHVNEDAHSQNIKDAKITVEDEGGNKYNFAYTEDTQGVTTKEKIFANSKMYIGRYEPTDNIIINNNYKYTAKVVIGKETYTAEYKPINPIANAKEKIKIKLDSGVVITKFQNKDINIKFYKPTLSIENIEDNVLIRSGNFYKNNKYYDDFIDIYTLKKRNTKQSISLNKTFADISNKYYGIKIISISDDMYEYLSKTLKNRIGASVRVLNDKPYFETRSNWNNGALGYFIVSDFYFEKIFANKK